VNRPPVLDSIGAKSVDENSLLTFTVTATDLYKRYGQVLSTKHYGNIKVKIEDDGKIFFTTQFQNYSDNWYILNERDTYYYL